MVTIEAVKLIGLATTVLNQAIIRYLNIEHDNQHPTTIIQNDHNEMLHSDGL